MQSPEEILTLLQSIPDPEIPVVSIVEMGMVRSITIEKGTVKVIVTPTYSGCPATETIQSDIRNLLQKNGIENYDVVTDITQAWTTDWIGEEARKKLFLYGIAPPEEGEADIDRLLGGKPKMCPQCHSTETKMISSFGSTPCKALYVCNSCLEPFDYFKCLK